jgi:glutathione S-transferase
MAALKIYGVAASRAFRTLWLVEELGIGYELVPTGWADGACRTPEFLAINPNGRVPAIDDDGVILWESLAINLYLARKHGGELAARTLAEEGQTLQWSFWAATEIEKSISVWGYNRFILPPEQRDEKAAVDALEQLKKPLAVLDGVLAKTPHLVGGRFTVADLNVCAVLYRALLSMDLGAMPSLAAWLRQSFDRPAAKRAIKLRG